MYYIYLLKSRNKIYIGFTNNLEKRVKQHNNGENISTRHGIPWSLIYYEAFRSKSDAIQREKKLKYHAKGLIELKKRITSSLDGNGEG